MSEELFKDVIPFTGTMPIEVSSPPSVPVQKTQTQYHVAMSVQKPRDLDKIQAEVLREAEIAGDAFYYSWPVKDKRTGKVTQVTGPSIGLAMSAARSWTNCAVPVEYYETNNEWIFTAHFVDLEKGFTVSRVFRKRKGKGSFAGWSDDRAEDMTFQAAQSRAIRNVVCAGVPRWLVDRAVEVAKSAAVKGMTGSKLAEATDKAVKFLAGYGINEDRIVGVLGIPRTKWTADEIVTLRGMCSQLKDGQASADQLFPEVENPQSTTSPLGSVPDTAEKKQRKERSDKGTKRGEEVRTEGRKEAQPDKYPSHVPKEPDIKISSETHNISGTEISVEVPEFIPEPSAYQMPPRSERLVDQEIIDEIKIYSQKLSLNHDRLAAQFREDKGDGVKQMTNSEAGMMLGYLLDKIAEKEQG